MKLELMKRVGPAMSKMALKGKKASPDIAIFGGLALVIGGSIWMGKRSHDATCELNKTSAKIKNLKEITVNEGEEAEKRKRMLTDARKEFASKMLKTYGPPIAMILIGSYSVVWGRNGYKQNVLELGTIASTQAGKIKRLTSKIDEEHGEGTAAKWANGLEDKMVDYKDPETKKKEKAVVTVQKDAGIDGFAFMFDERSRRYSKDASLNKMMLKAAEKINLKNFEQRFISGMEWFNEIGYRADDVYNMYAAMYGSDKARDMVNTLMHSGWMKDQTCPPTYHYDDVYRNENETFIQGYNPQCFIEPVGMMHFTQLA